MKANKLISNSLISGLLPQAANNPRSRTHHNIHDSYNEKVQRFLNVIEYASYVRPHYHNEQDAWEGFIIIKGHLSILQFDHSGILVDRNELSPEGPLFGIELDSTFPHCITSLSDQAIVFEYKQGPYLPDNDKTFPQWAPTEQDTQVKIYHQWMKTAAVGERFKSDKISNSQ